MLFYDLFRHEPELFKVGQGQYLFKEGEQGDVMYVLISGTAQIIVGNRVMEEVEPGDILGEMALVGHGPRSASVLATNDCEFACINQKRFHFLVSQTPHFATEVMRIMANRLSNTDKALKASVAHTG